MTLGVEAEDAVCDIDGLCVRVEVPDALFVAELLGVIDSLGVTVPVSLGVDEPLSLGVWVPD